MKGYSVQGDEKMILKLGLTAVLAAGVSFGQQAASLAGHTRDVNVVACSVDGKMIASGGEDSKTILWNTASRQQIAATPAGGAVLSLAISPDGSRISSGERYNKLKLLDASGKEVKTLEGHQAPVIATAFTADGKGVISFSLDGGMRFWDAATGAAQGETLTSRDSYSTGAFSADRSWFAGGTSGGNLYLYNVALKKTGLKLQPGKGIRAVAFSPDGKTLAVALGDSTVRLFATADGKAGASAPNVEANGLAFSPDGSKIAVAGHDGEVKVIDATSMQVVTSMKGHGRTVRAVCFLPDGRSVVSGSFDMTVKIWPLR
jgi:WD40 repeat protein